MTVAQSSTSILNQVVIGGGSLVNTVTSEAKIIVAANDPYTSSTEFTLEVLSGAQSFADLVTQGMSDGSLVKSGTSVVGIGLTLNSYNNNLN